MLNDITLEEDFSADSIKRLINMSEELVIPHWHHFSETKSSDSHFSICGLANSNNKLGVICYHHANDVQICLEVVSVGKIIEEIGTVAK